MGQIVGLKAKPKRCNLNKLSQLGTPAAGEYILVSSDNSMNAAGQGNFDCYVEGDGIKAAAALELRNIMPLGVFDLSAYTGSTYVDLVAALNAMNTLSAAYKKGGMSVKFVQSSDNKYVQFRLMADEFTTDAANWQGVDDEPTVGSKNLVESGGVKKAVLSVIGEMANKDVTVSGTATTPTGISLKSGVKYVIYVQCSTATTYGSTGIWVQNGSNQFTMIALLTSEQYNEGYTMEYTPAEDVTLWVRPYSSGTVKVIVWKDSNYATLTEIASKQQEIVTNDIKNAIASEAFTYSDIVKTDGNLTSANITWPDGATGTMSITYTSGNPSQINYTHVLNGVTRSFRQTITYSNGEVASNTIVEI